MEVIYGLIPGMLVVGLGMLIVLFWAARNGQFDDLEGDAYRIIMDDEDEIRPRAANADSDQDAGNEVVSEQNRTQGRAGDAHSRPDADPS